MYVMMLGINVFLRLCGMKTRIKEFRARYDLTQEELAKKVGLEERLVFLWKGNTIHFKIILYFIISQKF